MIPKIRNAFNENFKDEYYDNLQQDVKDTFSEECAFRISETPVFIDASLENKIFDACDSIIEQLWEINFDEIRQKFIPKSLQSPSPMGKPHFLAIDFGLCDDGNGNIVPQLIELQAFPTLFFYQPFLGKAVLKHYKNFPKGDFHYFFSKLNDKKYIEEVRKVILGDEKPENVILMELYPEKQKTRIDFWATKQALGIEVVCMTQIIKEGKKLFYIKDGVKTPIHRIYNRVILDELLQIKDLKTNINLNDDLDVEWVTHPDWFFMISKCIMPLLKHKYIPKSYYLNDYPVDLDLNKYVLKPLFSFAGKGINLYPSQETINDIKDKENYILQQKVNYASLVKTNSEKNSKVELRILYIWDEAANKLKPVINLTRMSKGELINVSHLTEDTWIGSSISFFKNA
ncbi:hypothetical protein FF125_12235 [Aureibaculum algae]|uniref:Circularly permuted type 2 ATP-grasp protein n=1 Tax=Aureibaculum algae TaxID=2584122 RepID=A0A5B7TWB9_9FLAO|nr:hypothetical protein [Aureibaculum algae]QCX39167.1 hypothetical protein FF125_12235 [Aureibaculum algae]